MSIQTTDKDGNVYGHGGLEIIGADGKPKSQGGGVVIWGAITGTLSDQTDLQTALNAKVNTIPGKGLSTNDYTDAEKSKLAGIAPGAEVNVNADWNATSGDAQILNKPTIPSIAGLATVSYVDQQDATKEPLINPGTVSQYFRGDKTFQTLDKSAVGLSNVDNTSDANKPVSTAAQTALNAKQNTLTLTTTGNSGAATLVGSTLNIPQYSGGGGGGSGIAGVQNMLGNLQGTGSAFGITAALNASNNSTYATTATRLDVYPFIPNKSLVNCSLSINVTTLGAGVLSRVVIYGDTNGFPGAKLYESADIDCSTTGTKTLLANFTFNAGTVYWLGLYSNGVTSLTGILSSALLPIFAAFANGIPANAWSRINTNLGTAPDPFQYNTYRNGAMPTIWIKPT